MRFYMCKRFAARRAGCEMPEEFLAFAVAKAWAKGTLEFRLGCFDAMKLFYVALALFGSVSFMYRRAAYSRLTRAL